MAGHSKQEPAEPGSSRQRRKKLSRFPDPVNY